MSYLIASYPRSGSTYLRFIISNMIHPDQIHNFDSMNRIVPAIDDVNNIKESNDNPLFYKTHSLRHGQNIIYLHRHVGDVLISEYWYKQKFHKDDVTMHEWLIQNKYGEFWRQSVNHYFPCKYQLSFKDINNSVELGKLPYFSKRSQDEIIEAISKSEFQKMQEVESEGFGIYPKGDEGIKFIRKGTSDQWKELDEQTQARIIERNYTELKILGYL